MQMLLFRIRRCSTMNIVVADSGTIRKLLVVQVITEIISFRKGQKLDIKLYPPSGKHLIKNHTFFKYPQFKNI